MKRIIVSIIALTLATAALAASKNNRKSRIHTINNQIAHVRQDLSHDTLKRTKLLKILRQTEIESGLLQRKLQKSQRSLQRQQGILKRLQTQANAQSSKLQSQQDSLAQELRTAYMLGRQPYFKLFFSQVDPSEISRVLTYYQYINKNRLTTIANMQSTLESIELNQIQLQEQTVTLTALQKKQQNERIKLERIKRNRKQLIHSLSRNIKSKRSRLSELLRNKHRLEQTLKRLERAAARQKTSNVNFARLRGKLAWPTRGRVLPYFGTKIGQSELRWSGILIKAPENRPIYAVANGKVVFAKWLAGYGLLLIVNHGKGYMTLYGRTHSLYKKVGDKVRAGELIARVGKSGGYSTPALYFAIRHNAKPLNPSRWCHRKAAKRRTA